MKKVSKEKINTLKQQVLSALDELSMPGLIEKVTVKSAKVIDFKIKTLKEHYYDAELFDEIMCEMEKQTGYYTSFDGFEQNGNIIVLSLMDNVLDIYSKGWYPSHNLSNFHPYTFNFDNVICNSMEGFLQSLKFKNTEEQKQVCLLVGKEAKQIGSEKFLWKLTGVVYWRGEKIRRSSHKFNDLIKRAYEALFEQNKDFRLALSSSLKYELVHTLGKKYKRTTILTEKEFISNLNYLRSKI